MPRPKALHGGTAGEEPLANVMPCVPRDCHSVRRPRRIRYAAPASLTTSKAYADRCSRAATPNAAATPHARAAAAAPRAAPTAGLRPWAPLRTTNIRSGPGIKVSATDTTTKITTIVAMTPILPCVPRRSEVSAGRGDRRRRQGALSPAERVLPRPFTRFSTLGRLVMQTAGRGRSAQRLPGRRARTARRGGRDENRRRRCSSGRRRRVHARQRR
jgi:hypothetical protein